MLTSALDSEHHHPGRMGHAVDEASALAAAGALLDTLVAQRLATEVDAMGWCHATCVGLEAADRWLLRQLKEAFRTGVGIFEHYQRDTFSLGGKDLVVAALSVPPALATYWGRVGAAGGFSS